MQHNVECTTRKPNFKYGFLLYSFDAHYKDRGCQKYCFGLCRFDMNIRDQQAKGTKLLVDLTNTDQISKSARNT